MQGRKRELTPPNFAEYLAIVMLFASIVFLCFVILYFSKNQIKDPWELLAGYGLAVILVGIFFIAWRDTKKAKITLEHDRISIAGVFVSKSMMVHEIKGYTMIGNFIVVKPVDSTKKTIRISPPFSQDPELGDWLEKNLTNLNKLEAETEIKNILTNSKVGETLDHRADEILKSKKRARTLNWAGGILGFSVLIWPNVYTMSLAAVFPVFLVLIVLFSRGTIKITERKDSALPNLTIGFLLVIALFFVRVLEHNIYSFANLWLPLSVICVTTALLMIKIRELRFNSFNNVLLSVGFICLMVAYLFSIIIYLNCQFDNRESKIISTTIREKRVSESKRSNTYYLILAPWEKNGLSFDLRVGKEKYDLQQEGDTITFSLREGALNLPWIEIDE
jgi:hypothetical protein